MTDHRCTRCQQPVLLAPNNRILTPKPTSLGIYDPATGEAHTSRRIAELVRSTGQAGHGNHHCPPAAQTSLFDQPQEVAG